MSEIKNRKFIIYDFDKKTRQLKATCKITTAPVSLYALRKIIKKEISKPIWKNSCYEILE